ncbi:MAG: Rrf2 family transcriptional regulator [Candidatus Omnitrophota bacterium]
MKISTWTRYGTRLMLNLALHYGKGPVLLKDIARDEELSEKYLSQIIIPLRTYGLVSSFRGARGGYALTKEPSQIKLREIVEILEGGLDLVECVKDPSSCPRTSTCVTRNVWVKITDKITDTLDGISLSDLVKQHRQKSGSAMMYSI